MTTEAGGACGIAGKPPILILVETMGSANLGAVARSAAAYNLGGFRLVAPRCKLTEESKKWACYGQELFPNVLTFPDLTSALHDVDIAVALSRREGRYRHRHFNLASLVESVLPTLAEQTQIAYVFGSEESGLKREHLSLCHYSAEIPVFSERGSLNLAHAVTVTLYEVLGRTSVSAEKPTPKNAHEERASLEWLKRLLTRSEQILRRIGYPGPHSTLDSEMVKLDRLAQRAGLETWEVRLLLGMLKQADISMLEAVED